MCSFYLLCIADPRRRTMSWYALSNRNQTITLFHNFSLANCKSVVNISLISRRLFFIPLLTVALYNYYIVNAEMTRDVVQSTPAFPCDGQTGAPMGLVDDPSRANQRHRRRRGSSPASITSCTNSWSLANLKKCRPGQRRKAALGL